MWFRDAVAERGRFTEWDGVIAERAGADPSMVALIKAVIATESSWNPDAINPSEGSMGLMQVLHGARGPYPGMPAIALQNPISNIQLGASFLMDKVRQYGATSDAISAYNAGRPLRLAAGGYGNQAYVDTVQTYWVWYLNNAPAVALPADPPPFEILAAIDASAPASPSSWGWWAVMAAGAAGLALWLKGGR
jgi:soluble lytic murein transglycosylase-like protein